MTDCPVSLTPPPTGYADWLAELKTRIHSAQQRATLAVNRECVQAVLAQFQLAGLAKPGSLGNSDRRTFEFVQQAVGQIEEQGRV